MAAGDVFAVSWQGGGGVGDPLDRDPDRVWCDVLDGLISADAAHDVYGVIGSTTVDREATTALRERIRRQRLGGREPEPCVAERDKPGLPLGPALRLESVDGEWEVRSAGHTLARGTTAWRDRAIAAPLECPGLHDDLAITVLYCPYTGRQLSVDVHERGTAPVDDIEIHW